MDREGKITKSLTPEHVPESMILPVIGKRDAFRSGELARLAGISPDTLRHYERKGLLPAPVRTPNGYRLYKMDALRRVQLIRSALAVGFTIKELGSIFKIRNSGAAPCEEVLRIAEKKLVELDARIRELRSTKQDLQKCVQEWNRMLLQTQRGTRAGLLEKLHVATRSSPMSPPGLNKNRRIRK